MDTYRFEPSDADELLRLLEPHANTATDPMALSLALMEAGKEPPVREALWGELQIALGYELDEDDAKPGAIEFRGRGYNLLGLELRTVEGATKESKELWQQLFTKASSPLLRAQLGDLVLTARVNTTPLHVNATIDAYREVAEQTTVDSLHRTQALMRANHLARTRNLTETERKLRAMIEEMADRALINSEPPGIVLRLLDVLSIAPRSGTNEDQRARTLGLLDRAEAAFAEPHAADSIANARRRLSRDESERTAATEGQYRAYMETARETSEGLLRMHWAQQAADLATKYGLQALHEEAIRFMQAIPPESMGWKVIEATVHIPRNALRYHLRRYRAVRDWRRAIAIFLASGSPTGSHERNLMTNAETSKGRLVSLFSRTVHGAHGMPERSGGDFETDELHRLEGFSLQNQGLLLSLELDEIQRRFGPIEAEDMAAWLINVWDCDHEFAYAFAEALDLHWRDDPSSAARLAVPLCESGMRRLLLALDEPVYRLERGKSPGRFPSMDFYIDTLERLDLDIDWVRAFRAEFLSEGLNVRNLFAHGFKLTFSKEEAAVTLRLAGLFVALSPSADDRLSAPLRATRRRLRRRLGWTYY